MPRKHSEATVKAVLEYTLTKQTSSMRKIAVKYGIALSTLARALKRANPKKER
jgi:lambda repressor-like predicted transcriptional regulator